MSTYTAKAVRSGKWWAIEVPSVPGVYSQARRLEQCEDMARDAIALHLDVDPSTIEVQVEAELAPAERAALVDVRRAKEARAAAEEREREAMQRAAAVLSREHSQRDAGRILGVSFQRISQLLSSKRAA